MVIQRKHRTLRELYNEAVSWCSMQECQGFKSIFISTSSVIDDSIEIAHVNMVIVSDWWEVLKSTHADVGLFMSWVDC
jgi:hypothetical protein